MRKVIELQQKFGVKDISDIKFDLQSRDEIPKLLIGLQHIYSNLITRTKVFAVLLEMVPDAVDPNNGRPGLDLWTILVLGMLRLNCNWDFDKTKEIADNHKNVREMLLISGDCNTIFPLQTIKDNISLFTPEILNKINQIVVEAGHEEVGHKKDEDAENKGEGNQKGGLKGRADSFVVETDVDYPTDIQLLFQAIRKMIKLLYLLCSSSTITMWRQRNKNISDIKRIFDIVRRLKRSTSKDEKKIAEKEKIIKEKHSILIELAEKFIEKAKITLEVLEAEGVTKEELSEVEFYIAYAEKFVDQIIRRVLNGEDIPHNEKVFSIFEEHTEWITKGKAGVSQELGLRVCIMEDQYGFILNHRVMEKQTDDKIAVDIVIETKEKFQDLKSCSFDKGFFTKKNKEILEGLLDLAVLPKKGKLSEKDKELEHSEEFVQARKQHSAVESAINALENHGLDRCPDHGIEGFKRYVALAVVARNIQKLGHIVQQKELKRQKRIEKYRKTWYENRAAA